MTTAPTASPELLDLDHLEALARAATPGPWSWWTSNSTLRLTGADGRDGGVLYGYARQGDGDVNCAPNNQAFIAAANPAAVLALIALARRARPEGEAPQAVTRKRFTEEEVRELALQHLHDDTESAGRNSFFTFSAEGLDGFAIDLMDLAAQLDGGQEGSD